MRRPKFIIVTHTHTPAYTFYAAHTVHEPPIEFHASTRRVYVTEKTEPAKTSSKIRGVHGVYAWVLGKQS
jgi:hypothetical protein